MEIAVCLRMLPLAALGLLLPAACGGAEPAPLAQAQVVAAPATAASPVAPRTGVENADVREIEVVTVDNLFQHSTLSVTPGERVRFMVVNQGQAPHTFTLRLGDQEVDVSLAAGESRHTAELVLRKPTSESPVITFKYR